MPKCILVVDDDRIVLEIALKMLQGSGYEVMTAQNGLEALEVMSKKIPDLILLDVQMPKLDGYGFIKEKKGNPVFSSIPVIVLTSLGKTEPLFKRYGVKEYLLKPIETHNMLEKIQAILST